MRHLISYLRGNLLKSVQKVAEKRGLHWALTSFTEAALELTKEEIEESSG